MNIESIIGVVAGIFGIVTGCAWLHGVMKQHVKQKTANSLLKQIVDKSLTDVQRRNILGKLNKNRLVNGRIKESYINNFVLGGKGIEKLFLEICVENRIEPTEDLCRELIDTKGQSLRKQYSEISLTPITKQEVNKIPYTKVEEMVQESTPKQTIYFSQHLTAYKSWANIRQALEVNGIAYGLLPNTKDVWARDYMPAYSNGHYVSYVYNPDYLQNEKDKQYITDNVEEVFDLSNDSVTKTKLVIDGGNVIMCGDKIIMTDKIFVENSSFSKEEVVAEIERVFSAKLVVIPWDNEEKFGHADGMVRYVSDNHVLINNYKDIDPELRLKILDALSPYFSQISELEYGSAQRVNSWAHINYLQVNNLIFVPQLEIPSDKLAIEQISRIFPDSTIIPVEVKGIVKKGGALNCVSWNYYNN
ncbi:MAG: agmatine deiminase family protein [Bacteroidaceae bacterium]|nr:agmatine deiminase family protein [Bacteroidaceae bacterium]